MLAAPHLVDLLQISTILLFLTSINGAQNGALSGFEAFKTVARISLWSGLTNFPLMVGGVYFAGLKGAVWGMVIAASLNWLFNHIAIRKECSNAGVPYTYNACWKEREVLWRFSLPSVFGGALVGPSMWAASALLVNQPNGYSEMGIYNAVLRIKQIPEMILSMIMAPLLPILSEQFGNKSIVQYNKTLKYAFLVSLIVLVPVSLIQIAAPNITLLPYGIEFQGNHNVVKWLMIHSILVGIFYPFGTVVSSMSKMWFGWAYNLMWSVLYISGSYLLITKRGAMGLAIAFSVAHFVSCIFMTIYIYRKEPAFMRELPFINLLSITVCVLLVSLLIENLLSPFMAGLAGFVLSIIYVILLKYYLKDFEKQEGCLKC
jgi:O-antigen/teichoic acid export membrane protein